MLVKGATWIRRKRLSLIAVGFTEPLIGDSAVPNWVIGIRSLSKRTYCAQYVIKNTARKSFKEIIDHNNTQDVDILCSCVPVISRIMLIQGRGHRGQTGIICNDLECIFSSSINGCQGKNFNQIYYAAIYFFIETKCDAVPLKHDPQIIQNRHLFFPGHILPVRIMICHFECHIIIDRALTWVSVGFFFGRGRCLKLSNLCV